MDRRLSYLGDTSFASDDTFARSKVQAFLECEN
jgi:hypothetical protein